MKVNANLNSVVQILATQGPPAYMHMVAGTGWFPKHELVEEGTIITNAHVVRNAKAAFIRLPCAHTVDFKVRVIGMSTDLDIAVLQLVDLQEVKSLLKQKYGSDTIPTLEIGDSDQLIARGDIENEDTRKVYTRGYPLGNEYQETTSGVLSGVKHAKEQLYLCTDAAINPGNSGGPAIHDGKVIGINTMKVRGATEINMQIPSNRLLRVLPELLNNTENREQVVRWMALAKMAFAKVHKAGEQPSQEQLDHVANMVHGRNISADKLKVAFESNSLGGLRKTKNGEVRPVTISEWYMKHVYKVDGSHKLFTEVLDHIEDDNFNKIHEMRSNGFGTYCLTASGCKSDKKVVYGNIPPRVLHYPRLAFKTSNSSGQPTLNHYGNPEEVQTGVIVSDVIKGGLMDKAGIQKYDFLYNIVTPEGSFDIDNYGESWFDKLKVSLPINDVIHRTSFDQDVVINVVRGTEKMSLVMNYTYLRQEDKPHVRALDSLQDMPLARQVATIAGITVTPLRLNHVMAFRLGEYLDPHKQSEFKIIVQDIAVGTPAFHTRNLRPGDVLAKINGDKVSDSWNGFVQQVKSLQKTVTLESERGAIIIL